jgi:hypothetical protein
MNDTALNVRPSAVRLRPWAVLAAAWLLAASCSEEAPSTGRGMDTGAAAGVVYPTDAVRGCVPMDDDGALSVVAAGLTFDPLCLAATANEPFVLHLENRDAGIRHNLSIYAGPRMYAVNAPNLFRGSVVRGPGRARYPVPGLPAGTWQFLCDIHSEIMVGVFTVPVEVRGTGFVPDRVELPQGLSLSFLFAEDGAEPHAITDSSGVYGGQGGTLDSGEQPAGALFSFKFVAAGSYGIEDPTNGHQAVVDVPVTVEPSVGGEGDRFRVTWSRFPLQGFVHDVQIRRPGIASFQNWLVGTERFEGWFEPDWGPGTYAFRARLRAADGRTSGWSPVAELAVDG